MIETEGGNTVVLMTEEFFELARNLTPPDFQALMLDAMKKQCARVMTLEEAKAKLVREGKELQKRVAVLEELFAAAGGALMVTFVTGNPLCYQAVPRVQTESQLIRLSPSPE